MEKKVAYSKPLMVMERFTPQEFVAGCPAPVPGTVIYQDNGAFYADIYDASGYSGTFGQSDGECHVQNECFSNGAKPNGAPKKRWFKGYTLYKHNGNESAHQEKYNSRSFSVIAGCENVDIYFGTNLAYIYINGSDGVEIDPTTGEPVKNFS